MTDKIKYKLIRSKRKTISIEILKDSSVLVRAPGGMAPGDIDKFVTEKADWIRSHIAVMEERRAREEEEDVGKLSHEQIRELADKALKVIPQRVRYFAPLVGVTYGRITIRNQRTRWGSCSSKGNLNFNCLLMLMPEEILDYVVVHELAHRKEMNHSKEFWDKVESVLPDYRRRKKWLKENGERYMRMQG